MHWVAIDAIASLGTLESTAKLKRMNVVLTPVRILPLVLTDWLVILASVFLDSQALPVRLI